MDIELTVHIWREGNQFVAHAQPLDVMSSGPTIQAARDAVDEAVRVFLKTASEIGTLDQVLEEAGYQFRDGTWISPEWVGVERHAIAV